MPVPAPCRYGRRRAGLLAQAAAVDRAADLFTSSRSSAREPQAGSVAASISASAARANRNRARTISMLLGRREPLLERGDGIGQHALVRRGPRRARSPSRAPARARASAASRAPRARPASTRDRPPRDVLSPPAGTRRPCFRILEPSDDLRRRESVADVELKVFYLDAHRARAPDTLARARRQHQTRPPEPFASTHGRTLEPRCMARRRTR